MTLQSGGAPIDDGGAEKDQLLQGSRNQSLFRPQGLAKGRVGVGGSIHQCRRVTQWRPRQFQTNTHERQVWTRTGSRALGVVPPASFGG